MAQVDLSIIIPIAVLAGLGFAGLLARDILRRETGSDRMREIATAIQQGARAFLRRQYKSIALIASALAILFAVAIGAQKGPLLGFETAGAFALGATFSALSGYIGMHIAIRSNLRSAAGSLKSFNDALVIALRGGAVSGLAIVSMSLTGVALLYYGYGALGQAFGLPLNSRTVTDCLTLGFTRAVCESKAMEESLIFSIVGFGFGASLVALFAQLGGGIYTKAADVGADLVGKVEAGIPEDDPRNPAVIADLVGDNVGDCAGRGADLFESTAAENIGALVVKAREDEDPMHALNRGYMWTAVLAALGFAGGTYWLLNPAGHPAAWWHFALCGVIGIATSIAFVYITQYYTEYRYRPVKSIAAASVTGPATNIIAGFAVALECTALPTFTIV